MRVGLGVTVGVVVGVVVGVGVGVGIGVEIEMRFTIDRFLTNLVVWWFDDRL